MLVLASFLGDGHHRDKIQAPGQGGWRCRWGWRCSPRRTRSPGPANGRRRLTTSPGGPRCPAAGTSLPPKSPSYSPVNYESSSARSGSTQGSSAAIPSPNPVKTVPDPSAAPIASPQQPACKHWAHRRDRTLSGTAARCGERPASKSALTRQGLPLSAKAVERDRLPPEVTNTGSGQRCEACGRLVPVPGWEVAGEKPARHGFNGSRPRK
jgi:hypothetical protein